MKHFICEDYDKNGGIIGVECETKGMLGRAIRELNDTYGTRLGYSSFIYVSEDFYNECCMDLRWEEHVGEWRQ